MNYGPGGAPKHGFQKGVSGNPSGRPKKHTEVIRLAQLHSVEALEKVVEIMRQKKSPKMALKAAEIILDRAWGKAPQAITGPGGDGPVKVTVCWQNADVAVLDVTPNKDIPLLEAVEVEDGNEA
jgi:Family of unknown function (DUF5681)